jgi:hypothetical protein
LGDFERDDDDADEQPQQDDRMSRILAQAGVVAVNADGSPAHVAERPNSPHYYLWPECLPLWDFWGSIQTQWRVGMSGASGLCWESVLPLLDRTFRTPRKRKEARLTIADMERAALRAFAERRAREG